MSVRHCGVDTLEARLLIPCCGTAAAPKLNQQGRSWPGLPGPLKDVTRSGTGVGAAGRGRKGVVLANSCTALVWRNDNDKKDDKALRTTKSMSRKTLGRHDG